MYIPGNYTIWCTDACCNIGSIGAWIQYIGISDIAKAFLSDDAYVKFTNLDILIPENELVRRKHNDTSCKD